MDDAPEAMELDYQLLITTAGAPPSPTTIVQRERMGFRIVHIYGTDRRHTFAVTRDVVSFRAAGPG